MRRLSPALLLLIAGCDGCDGDGPGLGNCDPVNVLINEALPDAPGDDEGYEWIELVNLGEDDVDLSQFYIGWQKSESSTGETVGFPDGTTLEGDGYLLVGEAEVSEAAVEVDLDLGQGSGGDGVYLFNACGEAVDALVYGDSNDDDIPDETGGKAASYAGKPGSGESLARCAGGVDGVDSDSPGDDFIVMGEDSVTPGAENVCPCESVASDVQIVINEIMVDPEGSDGGLEWIELLNVGSEDACLDLWYLEVFKSDPTDGTEEVLPLGMYIPAGSRLTLGGEDVDFVPDAVMDFSFGNGDEGDAVHLYDYDGALEDAIVYGGSNEDQMEDENGLATSIAEDPGGDISLARCPDGSDTDASGDDFLACMTTGGTPGQANDACCGGGSDACDQASDVTVVVNEVMVNPEGSDSGNEWIELYNDGNGSVDLSGWRLSWYKSSPDSASGSFALPEGTNLGARSWLLIGDENIAGSDIEATLEFGNGSDGDAIHLADCGGTLEDAIVYGNNNDDGMVDENGLAGSVAEKPGDDEALARQPDGSDSDDSERDFCISSGGTAGSANSCD